MINKKIFILIYYLLILFFKSENIFKETMGGHSPLPLGHSVLHAVTVHFFSCMCLTRRKGGIKMSVIRCKTCKNLFNTAKQERYCSEECRKEARKKVRKKWETKNPEYMKNYMREYREK